MIVKWHFQVEYWRQHVNTKCAKCIHTERPPPLAANKVIQCIIKKCDARIAFWVHESKQQQALNVQSSIANRQMNELCKWWFPGTQSHLYNNPFYSPFIAIQTTFVGWKIYPAHKIKKWLKQRLVQSAYCKYSNSNEMWAAEDRSICKANF